MLQILVLGPIKARLDDRVLRLGGPKQRALLARLALNEGRPVLPEQLIDDLWGHDPPRDPVHALQAHVSRLRATLPIEVGVASGGYHLEPGAFEVDAVEFTALAERGHAELADSRPRPAVDSLRAAEALWRGPAFGDLAESPGLRPTAVGLEGRRTRVLTERIAAQLACGEHAAVVGELQTLVARDPLQEQWWAQLVTALHRDGRRADALAVYQDARTTILDALGLEPGEHLTRAHREVLQDPQPVATDPAPTRHALPEEIARRRQSRFSGRAAELAELEQAWERRDRGPQLVTISGEPGIGKTRLASEFAARCADRGARVLFGRCDDRVAIPYQPLSEMLHDYVRSSPAETTVSRLGPSPGPLVRVLPELAALLPAAPAPASDPETERFRTFEAVAGWLARACTTAPLLLVIDDLQWADEATLLLLRRLLRSPHPLPLLIVATHRDRDHRPGPSTTSIVELVRQSEQVTRIALTGLSRAELEDLLTEQAGSGGDTGAAPTGLASWVETASGGNPLFALELARQSADAGLAGEAALAVPEGIRDVVEQRVGHLSEPVRDLLGCAAVVGRSFDPTLVQEVLGLTPDDLDEQLSAAAYTRLVEPTAGPRLGYVFSHDVVRAALYDAIPPLRRAGLHREVAVALERRHLSDLSAHYHDLAHQFSAAAVVGPTSEAIHYLVLAGRAALEQRAPTVAVDYFRHAIELSPPDTPRSRTSDLLTELGIAEFQAGRPGYRESLLRAAELAQIEGDTRRLAAAAVANSRGWWSSTAETDDERVAVLESALASDAGEDPAIRSRLLSSWALENIRDPARRLDAVRHSSEALRLARGSGDDLLLGRTLADHFAVTYASFSDPRGCADISAELVDVGSRTGDPGLAMMAAVGHAQSTLLLADLETSDRYLAQAEQAASELNHHARLWLVRTWQAMRSVLRGDLDGAEATAAAALDLGLATDQPDALTWFAGQLFTIRWMQGRLDELIDEIEAQVSTQAGGIPAWRAAHALALAEVGRVAEAEQILDAFLDTGLAELPYDMLWLQGVAYLCTVAAAADRPDAARFLYDVLAPYAGLLADNATIGAGPVDVHLAAMARVLGDDRLVEHHRDQAVLICERIDAPLWLRRVRAI